MRTIDTGITEAGLMDAWLAAHNLPPYEPGSEYTSSDWAKRTGRSPSTSVNDELKKWVAAGLWQMRRVRMPSGNAVTAYRPVAPPGVQP